MHQTDMTTREAFTSTQRAFVVVTDLEKTPESSGGLLGWRISPPVINEGVTTTTNFEFIEVNPRNYLQIETNYEWPPSRYKKTCLAKLIASPPDPDELFYAKPKRLLATVNMQINRTNLGPKGRAKPEEVADERFISADDFRAILDKRKSPFFYGEIRYNDIFPKTKQHITKYCFGLFGIRGDGSQTGSPVFSRCSHWNCTDDECNGDKERFEAEIAEAAKQPERKLPAIDDRLIEPSIGPLYAL